MTKVRALKNIDEVTQVGDLLNKHYGKHYEQIWYFALNGALRMGDALDITMKQAVEALETGFIEIKEQKTSKQNRFTLNLRIENIIKERKKQYPKDTWLFQSHSNNAKAREKQMSVTALYQALKGVGEIINVKLGTHSARKTRGRLLYENGYSIEQVAAQLNHKDTSVTLVYIDITQEEKDEVMKTMVI